MAGEGEGRPLVSSDAERLGIYLIRDEGSSESSAQGPSDDVVEHPSHYTQGGIECIDAIKAALTDQGWVGYLTGNVIKYVWRYRMKGGVTDLRKARFYLDALIKSCEMSE